MPLIVFQRTVSNAVIVQITQIMVSFKSLEGCHCTALNGTQLKYKPECIPMFPVQALFIWSQMMMLTFATKKLLTGTNGQKDDAASPLSVLF